MDSWSNRNVCDHRRSASIAGINGDYDNIRPAPYWIDNRMGQQLYTSYMDVNRGDLQSSWVPQVNYQDRNLKPEIATFPKPLESTFKEAISKMKASSICRLNAMENPVNDRLYADNEYNLNFMTLQPQKSTSAEIQRQSTNTHKIFRCNISSSGGRDKLSSSSTCPIDYSSDTRSDKTDKDNQYQSISTLYSNNDQYQDRIPKNVVILPRKNTSNSSVLIPKQKNSNQPQGVQSRETVPHVSLSQKKIYTSNFAFPGPENCKVEKKNQLLLDYLPPSYDSVTKPNTQCYERSNSIGASATNCQLIRRQHRNANQKPTEGLTMSSHSESFSAPPKEMSGFYKKNCPSPVKTKSISNMPSDFRKLHSAFLDQKKEIRTLKLELEQKNNYITQLETEIKSYEPWR